MTLAYIIGLLLAAMVLILFDFLMGTLGLLAILAVAAMAGAAWLGFTESTGLGIGVIVFVIIGMPAYVAALVKFLPRTRWGHKLYVPKVPPSSGTGTPSAGGFVSLVGKTGTAETLMRPAGLIRVAGQRVQARAESGFIEKGNNIVVVSAQGFDVVVRRADDAAIK